MTDKKLLNEIANINPNPEYRNIKADRENFRYSADLINKQENNL